MIYYLLGSQPTFYLIVLTATEVWSLNQDCFIRVEDFFWRMDGLDVKWERGEGAKTSKLSHYINVGAFY